MSDRHIINTFALLVIVLGCTYAYERESLRGFLPERFEHINVEYFHSQLSGVQVRWGSLSGEYGEARDDGSIVVDSNVTSAVRLDETLKHEMRHEFVGVEHQHDAVWQACMARYGSPRI